METTWIAREYYRIMLEEIRLLNLKRHSHQRLDEDHVIPADKIHGTVAQLIEIGKSTRIERSYISRYGISSRGFAEECVSSHTNLLSAIVDRALVTIYGPDFGQPESKHPRTVDGYSYRDIMEAIRLHDLPENVIGDIPDNGDRDEQDKSARERQYFVQYVDYYDTTDFQLGTHVLRLLYQMDNPSSPTGGLLKLADKTAATLMALIYDLLGHPPLMRISDPLASPRDIEEMHLCDYVDAKGYRRASEMWTIDHLHIRQFNALDSSGFFTSLIVMATLVIHAHWYSWRERDYLDTH